MAPDVRFVAARAEHVPAVALAMREQDRLEVLAAEGRAPAEALVSALEASHRAWTVLVDGAPAAMLGVIPLGLLAEDFALWFLTTHVVARYPVTFLRVARRVVRELLMRHPHLFNYVDARYRGAVRLLECLGARIGEPAPFGPADLPFRRFDFGGEP